MKMHEHIVKNIVGGSIADELGIEPGDRLLSINGNEIEDIFSRIFLIISFIRRMKNFCS